MLQDVFCDSRVNTSFKENHGRSLINKGPPIVWGPRAVKWQVFGVFRLYEKSLVLDGFKNITLFILRHKIDSIRTSRIRNGYGVEMR